MASGNIVLANTKSGFVPAAIRFMTDGQFSHSFVTMPNIYSIPMAIEAAENGVDFTRFDTGYQNNTEESYQVWQVNVSQKVKDAALVSILNDLETAYGYLEFFYFIWRKICRSFGKDIKNKNNWAVNSGYICSQLCVAYLKACGLQSVFVGYGNGSIAPADLYNIFMANPKIFKLVETVRL
jgi:hypothetical protein